jgi:hypothetical protein
MPNNAAGKAQRTARRERVWDLRLQGKTERDIATEIGTVSNVTIHNDLVYLIREATKHLDDKVKAERIFQLHQLHLVVKEAFEAWTESKKTGGQIVEKTLPATEKYPGGRTEKIVTQYKQTGNPAYLSLVVTTLESIRKLFGLDAFKDDWEAELRAAGYNPHDAFEAMVQAAYVALTPPEKEKTDARTDNLDKLNQKAI